MISIVSIPFERAKVDIVCLLALSSSWHKCILALIDYRTQVA